MDKITELSKKYTSNPFLRGIITLIPQIGGSIDILFAEKWNVFYHRRIENMLEQLTIDLSEVSDKIDLGYLESEDFFDIIYKILQDSIQTRLDDKRKIYSKIIRDSISYQKSTAETESLVEIVSSLCERDLYLIYQIYLFLEKTGKNYFSGEEFHSFLTDDNLDINEVVRCLYRLSYFGLLNYKTNVLTLREKIMFSRTPLFDEIHNYLNDE